MVFVWSGCCDLWGLDVLEGVWYVHYWNGLGWLVGGSLSEPTLNAFDIDNLVLNDNIEDHFSIEEELEDDGDKDNGGSGC